MQGIHLRKYGVETIINFELYEVDGVDLRVDAADAGSDCNIRKDQGADATCENDFVDEGLGYSLTLTATEMEANSITLYIIDSATKVWLDKTIIIETYGHASAQHLNFPSDLTHIMGSILTEGGAGRLKAAFVKLFDVVTPTLVASDVMRGTNNAALASVVGALADAAAAGEVTEADTLMQYLKQLINILIGAAGIGTFPAEAAPANAVSLAEVIRAIHADVTGLNGSAIAAKLLAYVQLLARSDAAIETDNATELTEINADGGSGAGNFSSQTDADEAIRDRGDAAWAGAPEACSGTLTVQTADTVFNLTATLGTLSTQDDTYNNMIICILDDSGSVYETARITDYDGTNTRITIDHELTFPVDDGVDTWVIYRNAYAPVGEATVSDGDMNTIADKVWDELDADHMTQGTKGLKMHHAGRGRY